MGPRHLARELTLKLAYEYSFLKTRGENTLEELLAEAKFIEENKKYINTTYEAFCANYDTLEAIIKTAVQDFSFSQLYRIDLCILMLAVCEIKYCGLEKGIAINEAIELAKQYSGDKSPGFINGVLSTILKSGI